MLEALLFRSKAFRYERAARSYLPRLAWLMPRLSHPRAYFGFSSNALLYAGMGWRLRSTNMCVLTVKMCVCVF